ncbi:MAG: Gfo/Idh/MocA family oxidoreductase [Planctomycetaceae bacterium]|nr:Gfo/Idh/MocA family oxidoreductase [Planctomycetaceae bacterium]
MRSNRRDFLKSAAAAGFATFVIGGTKASRQVLGANERIRVAVCGINGRGQSHIGGFSDVEGVEVAMLVDPDSRLFGLTEKAHGLKAVQDARYAFDDPNIDVVSVATPNHWHSLLTIRACQAGKDVYVEKPLSHNIFEGRKCVEAARHYNRMVQHGTQSRSDSTWARTVAAVHSEKYGKLLVSKGYCCKARWSIGTKPTKPAPAELDFNIWLGPAPEQPYHENLVHYNWHWFWDFGNGDTGNQGVHQMDVAMWGIKNATLPTRVWSLGGRFGYEDQGQTPNTQLTVFEYGDAILLFETRGLVKKDEGFAFAPKVTNEFFTTEGMLSDGKFYPRGGGEPQPVELPEEPHVTPGGPFGSFITAVRSRKVEDLNADVEIGHNSSALCHLSNISYRLGKQVPFSASSQSLGDNAHVVESFEMIRANLQGVGVKLEETEYRLGRDLAFDPAQEKFVGDDEANKLLTREYRKGFEVPATIG